MKFISQLLAAMLLWIFIACNQGTGRQDAIAKNKQPPSQNITMQQAKAPATPTSGNVTLVEMKRSPGMVKHGKSGDAKIENKNGMADAGIFSDASNTEDYDNIVENKFLYDNSKPFVNIFY